MKKCLFILFVFLSPFAFSAADNKANPIYKSSYECGMDFFKANGAKESPIPSCVGNSHDPSKLELQAYKDAERDYLAGVPAKASSCNFGYGVWVASGSRADNSLEGPQRVPTLREIARLLTVAREVKFYDLQGRGIPIETVNHWFTKKGETISVSDEAKKTCTKKQTG